MPYYPIISLGECQALIGDILQVPGFRPRTRRKVNSLGYLAWGKVQAGRDSGYPLKATALHLALFLMLS